MTPLPLIFIVVSESDPIGVIALELSPPAVVPLTILVAPFIVV